MSHSLDEAQQLVNELEGLGFSFHHEEHGWEIYGHKAMPARLSKLVDAHANELPQVLAPRMIRCLPASKRIH